MTRLYYWEVDDEQAQTSISDSSVDNLKQKAEKDKEHAEKAKKLIEETLKETQI